MGAASPIILDPQRPPLSRRQMELIAAIRAYTAEHGRPPTYRNLMQMMGVENPNAISSLVKVLVRKGYLVKGTRTARCLKLIDADREPETEVERIARLRCEAREATARYNKALRISEIRKGVHRGHG